MSWMQPACEEAARLISQQRDEPLGRWQRLRLHWHLARCGDCREVERQLARIGALGRDGFVQAGPGAGESAQR